MMQNKENYTLFVKIILGALILTSPALSYDRDAAVDYAKFWSAPNGVINESVYREESQDCANFVSQCLIAGGIKFRSSVQSNDNTRNLLSAACEELETGYYTYHIKDGNLIKYSRTICSADHLAHSIKHLRHGCGVEYYIPELVDSGDLWTNLEPGDICFQLDGNTASSHMKHAMFVTTVEKSTSPKELKYCAHNAWRRDHDLQMVLPGWKTSGGVKVVCLRDAPTMLGPPIIYSAGSRIKWKWGTLWCQEGFAKQAINSDLILRLTFDTDMLTSELPDIKLLCGSQSQISFSPWTDNGYTNGWWTDASASGFVKNRTWKGRILASALPANWHGMATISVNVKHSETAPVIN